MTAAQILGSVVIAAIVTGAIKLVRDWRKRVHAEKVARRERLGPKFRELIGICQNMQGVATRLENDPAQEIAVEPDAIRQFRTRLDAIVEPDLAEMHKQVDDVLTEMTQWWGAATQVVGMTAQGQDVNPKIRNRIDDLAESVGGNLERIKDELKAQLKELEG